MIYFHGVGHFHPENELDNEFFESLDMGTTSQWIVERVGIERRRTVLPLDYIRATRNQDVRAASEAALYSNAETGARAASMALERAGLSAGDIGMVIAGGCSPDMAIPAEAARIARELGIEAPAFDMHAACSTFGAHVHMVEKMGGSLPDFVLIVCPENMTRVLDFSDRASAILFGDATSAAVVSTRVPSRARCVFNSFGSDPSGCDEVRVPRTGHFVQNGSVVQKFAIKKMTELLSEMLFRVEADKRDRVIYVGHQANLRMLEGVCRRCDIPAERHFFNIVEFGNQSAAGAPAVISQRWDDFQAGDVLCVAVVGSGLAWAGLQIEFG